MNAEKLAIATLSTNSEILAILAHGVKSIFKQVAPDTGDYPYIVLRTLTDSPNKFSDDTAYVHSTTFRITIVTTNGVYDTLATKIRDVLMAAGFIWAGDTTFEEKPEKDRILEFIYEEIV